MSRFGGRTNDSRGKGRSDYEEDRDYDREERRSSRRSSGSKRRSQGRRRNSDNGGGQFTNIGSITLAKSEAQSPRKFRNSETKMWAQIWLPEDMQDQFIKLRHGDKIFLHLGNYHENAPDYVVGSLKLPPEDND